MSLYKVTNLFESDQSFKYVFKPKVCSFLYIYISILNLSVCIFLDVVIDDNDDGERDDDNYDDDDNEDGDYYNDVDDVDDDDYYYDGDDNDEFIIQPYIR